MGDNSAIVVLLVDDDSSIREMISRQLKREGFVTVQAEDGIDGLVKLRDQLPNVIISDLQMPRMSGFEFISVVQQRFPSIPIIVLAGAIPKDLPAEIKPYRCLEKSPRIMPELLKAIRDLARQAPNEVTAPPAVNVPVRARAGGAGYVSVPCTDCMRIFPWPSPTEPNIERQTGVCPHCGARVPYLIEAESPA
jgi:CheY-like chemotaxis protein